MNGQNRIFTGLKETNNRGDFSIFDGLYELQRRVLVDHEAVHAATVAQLGLEGRLVGLAEAKDLRILEVGVEKVDLERVISL